MNSSPPDLNTPSGILGPLLRGDPGPLAEWTTQADARRAGRLVLVIVAGAGGFGAALGCWRDPWQALFSAAKLPLILLLTAMGNALLNGMLAPLLGARLALRQTALAVLASFALAAATLGAFSPLAAFVIWNAPPLAAGANNSGTHAAILLLLVGVVAFAGIAANLRLLQLLQQLTGEPRAALRVLFAWLAGNLFLGSQLSWILRPFIGSPNLPVEFLRPDAWSGNFYEAVGHAAVRLFN